jgi:hypothetical protein
VFIYWGWDCALSVNEETKDSARTPGRAAVMAMIGGLTLLGAFVLSVKSYWPAASSYSSFLGIGGIFLIGAGSLVVGVIVMVVTSRFLPRYFAEGITTSVRDEDEGSATL